MGLFGGIAEGYGAGQDGALRRMQLQQAQMAQAGAGDAGDALLGRTQAVPGAQSMNPLQALAGRIGGMMGMQPKAPPQPQAPSQPMGGGGGAPPPQGGMAPPQGGGGSPGFSQGGQLDLPSLIQGIKQRKPDISGQEMMAAIGSLQPLLNSQGLMQYRQAMLGLRANDQQFKQGPGFQEKVMHDRATEGTSAGNLQERGRHDQAMEGQGAERLGQSDRRMDIQQQQFHDREARMNQQFETRARQAEDKMNNAKTQKERDDAAKEIHAAVAEREKETQLLISTANSVLMDPADQKAQIDRLKKSIDRVSTYADGLKLRARGQTTPEGAPISDVAGAGALPGAGSFSSNNQPDVPERQGLAVGLQKKAAEMRGQPAPAGKVTNRAEPAAQPGREPGKVIDVGGKKYRFKGGDYDVQSNWEPVQ